MIQIGNKIWITDDLKSASKGKVRTIDSQVHFEGEQIKGVSYLGMTYDADQGCGDKVCSVYLVEESDEEVTLKFAKEMAMHGFNTEVVYLCKDKRRVEYYISNESLVEEVSVPALG